MISKVFKEKIYRDFSEFFERMKRTIVLRVHPERPQKEIIRRAAKIIRTGGLVAFPTETVYGLGADALNPSAVLSLFRAKERPLDNPPIIHVGNMRDVERIAEEIPEKARILMERFWPGPLTLVLKRSDKIPAEVVSNLNTVAVRMPSHRVALFLIQESSRPIAAPSANLAGRPSPTRAEHVLEDLNGRIDMILDAGPTTIGVESTVLDMTSEPPIVLRPGGITVEELRDAIGEVRVHPMIEGEIEVERPKSPGMKYRHYAPRARMVVVEGDEKRIPEKISELAERWKEEGLRVGIIVTEESKKDFKADIIKILGSRGDLKTIARNLFRTIREVDSQKVDIIIAEGVPQEGLGLAIMNRLRKASSHNIIRV